MEDTETKLHEALRLLAALVDRMDGEYGFDSEELEEAKRLLVQEGIDWET